MQQVLLWQFRIAYVNEDIFVWRSSKCEASDHGRNKTTKCLPSADQMLLVRVLTDITF